MVAQSVDEEFEELEMMINKWYNQWDALWIKILPTCFKAMHILSPLHHDVQYDIMKSNEQILTTQQIGIRLRVL